MWQVSHTLFWIPLYILLLFVLFQKLEVKKCIFCLILLILLIITTDQLGSTVIRPLIGRLRPSSPMDPISQVLHFVNDYRGGTFGFPSSHAANTFALTTFMSFILKSNWVRYGMLIWALLVTSSRIYLGVHYPTDIIAGAFLGIVLGYNFSLLFKWLPGLASFSFINNYRK